MKQLNEINLQTFSDGLSAALSKELGGEFSVSVQKLEVLPGALVPGDKTLTLTFVAKDKSWAERSGRYAKIPTRPEPETEQTDPRALGVWHPSHQE